MFDYYSPADYSAAFFGGLSLIISLFLVAACYNLRALYVVDKDIKLGKIETRDNKPNKLCKLKYSVM